MARRTRLETDISSMWYKQAKKYKENVPSILSVGINGGKLYFIMLENEDLLAITLIGEDALRDKLCIPRKRE